RRFCERTESLLRHSPALEDAAVTSISDLFTMLTPLIIFLVIVGGVWAILNLISGRNTQMQGRLERMTRMSQSSMELPDVGKLARENRSKQFADVVGNLGDVLKPQTEQEQSALRLKLSNAGFRSDSAVSVYLGLRIASLIFFSLIGFAIFVPKYQMSFNTIKYSAIFVALGFYLPSIVLWYLVSKRKQEIFLTLPDSLDLLVVCVESG